MPGGEIGVSASSARRFAGLSAPQTAEQIATTAGVPDASAADIAEFLGLDVDSVRAELAKNR